MTVKVEFSVNTVELQVKDLNNHLNATGICLRTSFNFKIKTNYRPQYEYKNEKKKALLKPGLISEEARSERFSWSTQSNFIKISENN